MKKPERSNNKASQMGSVRIISGQFRGRKLPVLLADGLRPTTDRIKETLFNWLMTDIRDAHCLDCFAGSGSLGFEALSRGAASNDFIEQYTPASRQLKQNLATLKLTNSQIFNGDCLQIIQTMPSKQYQVVFIDPPFRKNLVEPVCQLLEQHQRLAKNALIYVECEQENSQLSLPTNWQLLKEKNAGQVCYRLYQRTAMN